MLLQRPKGQKKEQDANIREAGNRIKEYGIYGFLEHLVKKTLMNYSDGTWAWGMEGEFYREYLEPKNQILSPFIRDFYYNEGGRFSYFISYAQSMWMLLLGGCVCCVFVDRKKQGIDHAKLVLFLSILGLTVFELLFEARARYLYCYIPIYILIANVGLDVQTWKRFVKGRHEMNLDEMLGRAISDVISVVIIFIFIGLTYKKRYGNTAYPYLE